MSDALMTAWTWLQVAFGWAGRHHRGLSILIGGLVVTAWANLPAPRRRRPTVREIFAEGDRRGLLRTEEWAALDAAFARHDLPPESWVRRAMARWSQEMRRDPTLRAHLVLALKGKTNLALRRLEVLAKRLKRRKPLPESSPGGKAYTLQAIYMGAAGIALPRDEAAALRFCEQARAAGPELLFILHPLGLMALSTGRMAQAAEAYEQAVALHQATEPRLRQALKDAPGVAGVDAYADLKENEQGLAEALGRLEQIRKAGGHVA